MLFFMILDAEIAPEPSHLLFVEDMLFQHRSLVNRNQLQRIQRIKGSTHEGMTHAPEERVATF